MPCYLFVLCPPLFRLDTSVEVESTDVLSATWIPVKRKDKAKNQ